MRLIVGLTGKRGSGKSTIAHQLVEEYGFARASFGDLVRDEAIARSLPTDVATLQTLGRTLIDEWGWTKFCQAAIAGTRDASKVVIDGIRHVGALETIRRLVAPVPLILVFVHLDESRRLMRLRVRGRIGDTDAGVESDPVEQEVDSLRALADFEIDGGDECAAVAIARWFQTTG